MSDEIETPGQALVPHMAQDAPPHPLAVIQLAVQQGASPETLEKLMALQERYEANEARKAFEAAFQAFKAEAPPIYKESSVNYETRGGGKTGYKFADLAHICEQIKPVLAKHGLSHRWDTTQTERGAVVTCYLTHVQGHSITASLEGPLDQSGGKNPIQALGSTVSYLQRYTLLTVTGLAPRGVDNDGNADGKSPAQRAQQTSDLHEQLAQAVLHTYRKRLIEQDATLADVNRMLPDVTAIEDVTLRNRVRQLIKDYTSGHGWSWDKDKCEFVLAPVPANG